jgi:hypothetical protein
VAARVIQTVRDLTVMMHFMLPSSIAKNEWSVEVLRSCGLSCATPAVYR